MPFKSKSLCPRGKFEPKMGRILQFLVYSLILTWLYNQLIRPLFDGKDQNKKAPKPKAEAKMEIQVEYRKFPPEEGDYVEYEEVK